MEIKLKWFCGIEPKMPQSFKKGGNVMFKRRLSIVALILCVVLLLTSIAIANDEPFKTKLNMFERLVVMGLLPQQGNFATLRLVTEQNMILGPSDEETVIAGLDTTPEGGVVAKYGWDKIPEKEFTFKETVLGWIKDALQKLDDEEKLTMEHFRVYEKFMLVKEKEEE